MHPPFQHDRIRIEDIQVLSNNWYTLRKVLFQYLRKDGTWEHQSREAYDRGNGAVILLYHPVRCTVILTRQFRMPTFLNGNAEGWLLEACAGLLDEENAEDCIRRETEEETGFAIGQVQKVYEAYMSPGSVTEILHFFIAPYDDAMRQSKGGGVASEHEEIEVVELSFEEAMSMVRSGAIRDAKTIMLLQYLAIHQRELFDHHIRQF
jgi:nudix-type nucleoside diphosphatase (YffH/AdpP family)